MERLPHPQDSNEQPRENPLREALAAATDFDGFLRSVFHLLKQRVEAEALSYLLYEKTTNTLCFYKTEKVGVNTLRGIRIPVARGIAGWVATRRQPIKISDPYQDPRFLDQLDKVTQFRTKNVIAVPLTSGERLLGVAQVLNKHRSPDFDDGDFTLVREAAQQAAETMAAAGSPEEIDSALRKLKDHIVSHIDTEAVSIYLYNAKDQTLVFRHTENREIDKLKDIRLHLGQGIAGWVAQERQPLLLEDAYEDFRFFKGVDDVTRFRTRSVMCVPVMDAYHLLGVLQVINRRDGEGFTAENFHYMRSLAPGVAEAQRKFAPTVTPTDLDQPSTGE